MNKYKKGDGENYKQGLTSKESLLISILAREDKKIFSINDARCVIEKDTKKTMSSLIRKKWVLPLRRGLYAIVPLEVGIKKKCRNYYNVWQLTKLKMNKVRLKTLLEKKFQYKGIEFKGLDDMFPYDLLEILEGYWERELGRLVHPVPEMKKVISDVRDHFEFPEKPI